MNIHDYYEQIRRFNDELEAKNKVVADFMASNPDLGDDDVYQRFWVLQNQATDAYKEGWEFQENNRGEVTQ
ncbi:hypothetical protein [Pseudomonas frederiksbergensis]|uniref:hypothetical protein n=1 Tax=Pseudomonas frederiksbergensis TaxID=104087 RepID=UPI00101AD120|nr:hypothetical protein [Pseudomonas frederiksbergensis]